MRKGWKSTLCSKLLKRWQNRRSTSFPKSARIEQIFCVLVSHIITVDLSPNHDRRSQYCEQRCAQTRSLFQTWNRCDFEPSMSQSINDASDCMKRSMFSLECYLSPGIGFSRIWKIMDDTEWFSQNQKVTLPVQNSLGSVTFSSAGIAVTLLNLEIINLNWYHYKATTSKSKQGQICACSCLITTRDEFLQEQISSTVCLTL